MTEHWLVGLLKRCCNSSSFSCTSSALSSRSQTAHHAPLPSLTATQTSGQAQLPKLLIHPHISQALPLWTSMTGPMLRCNCPLSIRSMQSLVRHCLLAQTASMVLALLHASATLETPELQQAIQPWDRFAGMIMDYVADTHTSCMLLHCLCQWSYNMRVTSQHV